MSDSRSPTTVTILADCNTVFACSDASSQRIDSRSDSGRSRASVSTTRWCTDREEVERRPIALAWQLARPTGPENSWTDGRDDARPVGWPRRSVLVVLEIHAVQGPRKPSPQVSQGEISGDELARVRCCSGAAGKPDTVVHGRGRGGMACAGYWQARRSADLFGDSHRDGSRTSPGVPPAAASNRRPAAIDRQCARARYCYPRSHNAEPSGWQFDHPAKDGWS